MEYIMSVKSVDVGIVHPVDDAAWEQIDVFDGSPRLASYVPIEAQLVGGDLTDFVYIQSGALFCSEEAWLQISGPLETEVEPLPMTVNGRRYYILNITNVLDCLDEQESIIVYWPDGRVRDVERYVFHEDKVEGAFLFKIPQRRKTQIFCTARFRQLIEETTITCLQYDTPMSPLEGIWRLAQQGFRPPL
jgi:hypothetical protein